MRRILLLACLVLPGCGAATLDVDATEAQRNREALLELRARGESARSAAADGSGSEGAASGIPELPTVVLVPERGPGALTADGALRRTAVDAFCAQGPHAVLGAIELVPAQIDGRLAGLRAQRIHPERGRWALDGGLREGDIVGRVNGRQITMPDAFMEVWDGLADAAEIRVVVLRDGTELELHWVIADE